MTREIVFVTGGGGYIGSSVVHVFMQHPAHYIVRLALRKESQRLAHLEKDAKEADRLQFFLFKDMTTAGCFDEALEGVSHVAHLASSTDFEPPIIVTHNETGTRSEPSAATALNEQQ